MRRKIISPAITFFMTGKYADVAVRLTSAPSRQAPCGRPIDGGSEAAGSY
jgi:hypothetical protein